MWSNNRNADYADDYDLRGLNGTRMTGSTGSMGFIKTEGQRDRVMYHKLQLVGCPRFISRHEGLVTENAEKGKMGSEKKRIIGRR